MHDSSRLMLPVVLGLRAGDWVQVRSKDEILSTLDDQGRLDGLPFQPEMLKYCNERLRVHKVAHKTCDTILERGDGRRMINAVHLEGVRCDGSAHGGCQAECLLFWKEAWLRRVEATDADFTINPRVTEQMLVAATQRTIADGTGGEDSTVWSCQATRMLEATKPLSWWDFRQYVRDVTSGNHGPWHMAKLLLFAAYRHAVRSGVGYSILIRLYNRIQAMRRARPYPVVAGKVADGSPTPAAKLDLQPGEWVEVKSPEEIMQTLARNGRNRGMRFDQEMLEFCGERYRVSARVERLINEQTGKMMQMKTPCIRLENVYCRAVCSSKRLGCPRAIPPYWREIWLKRV